MNAIDYKKNLKQIPNRDDHNCFACSPGNSSGLKMEFHTDEKKVYSWVTVPEHLCGWENIAHGGIISTILDEIMSWSAIYLTKRIIMTKTMSVDFLKPVIIGNELRTEGELCERLNEREAVMKGSIYNSRGEMVARSKGTFALFTPDAIRKMGIMDEKAIDTLEYMMQTEDRA